MKKLFLVLFLLGILTACSQAPNEQDIQTAIAQTLAVQPTPTLTFTIIPSFTFTPTLTITPTPTNTSTPTITNTATLLPPATLTQQAVELTQTKKADYATATQDARNQNATATSSIRTQTAQSRAATATEMASYKTIYWKELATYPENYIGEKVVVKGRVFNILGSVVQIYFTGTYEALYVNLKTTASGIYDGDSITVYGIVQGKECFTNAMGNQVCQPALNNAWFTKP